MRSRSRTKADSETLAGSSFIAVRSENAFPRFIPSLSIVSSTLLVRDQLHPSAELADILVGCNRHSRQCLRGKRP